MEKFKKSDIDVFLAMTKLSSKNFIIPKSSSMFTATF